MDGRSMSNKMERILGDSYPTSWKTQKFPSVPVRYSWIVESVNSWSERSTENWCGWPTLSAIDHIFRLRIVIRDAFSIGKHILLPSLMSKQSSTRFWGTVYFALCIPGAFVDTLCTSLKTSCQTEVCVSEIMYVNSSIWRTEYRKDTF